MEYVVYCDESRHDAPEHRYMAIGGLWAPRLDKRELTRRLRRVLVEGGLRAEVKWSKVSKAHLDGYRRLVDFFVGEEALRFRVIVVDQAEMDLERFHGGDRELGFYKFYYEMLNKWVEPGNEYLILLDYKQNKGADRYQTLRRFLERRTRGKAWITDLTVIDSREAPLGQLCDVLTGAVAAAWCGEARPERPKGELAEYLASRLGLRSLRTPSPSPAPGKFNIFRIELSARG
jgi:hypothetical protein